jgi:flagellar biosynthesis protein FlhA
LADFGKMTKDVFTLTELVRQQLSRNICASVADEEGRIDVITLDPAVEGAIQQAIQPGPQGPTLALNPQIAQLMLARLAGVVNEALARGENPAVLVSPIVRPHVKGLVDRNFPNLSVLSYSEINAKFKVQAIGAVSIAVGAA